MKMSRSSPVTVPCMLQNLQVSLHISTRFPGFPMHNKTACVLITEYIQSVHTFNNRMCVCVCRKLENDEIN